MSDSPTGKIPKIVPPSPADLASKTRHPITIPIVTTLDKKTISTASKRGIVEDGQVYVVDGSERHAVGPAVGDEPLLPYVRKYFDHVASLERFHARLEASELPVREIESSLKDVRAVLDSPDCVGDLASYRKRLAVVSKKATAILDKVSAEREAARAEAQTEREALVARAEEIAAKPVEAVRWKEDTAELRTLLDTWKEAQKSPVRIGKEAEHELWQRFAHARSAFEKMRKRHFAELEKTNAEVADIKTKLVQKAEALSSSKKWEETAREFRSLMNQWKAAGRGKKTSDDELWRRFQAAQDAFFEARRAVIDEEKSVESDNLAKKEAIVAEAESLLPITDLATAKTALFSLQDRFDAIGRVAKSDADLLHRRLGAVERAVREASEEEWTSRNPELEARVNGAAQQLLTAIADLEAQIDAARAKGDAKAVDSLSEALDTRRSWLEQIQSSGE